MSKITLIYFGSCPNYEGVKNLLLQIGVSFVEINQDDLLSKHPFKQFTSPAILKNDELIFGERIGDLGEGCSINIPDKWELERKLKS